MDVLGAISTRTTPQNRPAGPQQVPNAAGGYGFAIDDAARVRRFLTLGVDGGTFYTQARDLAIANASVVERMAHDDPDTLISTIVEISEAGRAPSARPALFALAYAASIPEASRAALDVLDRVARTGTHLLTFAGYVEAFRGWGRGLRGAVGRWYAAKDPDALAYQVVKYRARGGWSHRDLLRLSHPVRTDGPGRCVLDWVTHGAVGADVPPIIEGFTLAASAETPGRWADLVRRYRLTWEMLPDAALGHREVWEALMEAGIPTGALIRQLPRLTRLGVLSPGGGLTGAVADRITDPDTLARARVHPIAVLLAQRTYASGHSARGTSQWQPVPKLTDALDAAFYASFGSVRPSGARTLLALDVSGSMSAPIAGLPISAREASAALAMVGLATEPDATAVAFTAGNRWQWDASAIAPLDISPRRRLDDALRVVDAMPMGATDCALPMLWANRAGAQIDTFVVYTDNETWAGAIHPHQVLRQYREATGIPARLVVVAMTATEVSIADPDDGGMLDVAGFDAAVPDLVSDFSAGR